MATTVQEVSSQLMKSPKELASWNFPLTQILEEYFELLPEPCKIQYGEAALVIQNSVNAYARRVEELYDETRCFSQKMILESKDDDEKNPHKEHKSKKNLIDFSRFNLLDFSAEVGKNINMKVQEGKSLKLLHRCFSQLENPHTKLHIDVYDVQGEIIGKKYDFRCNQQITKHGTLVEELNPDDFKRIHHHQMINDSNSEVSRTYNEAEEVPSLSAESIGENNSSTILDNENNQYLCVSVNNESVESCLNDTNKSQALETCPSPSISDEFFDSLESQNVENDNSNDFQDNNVLMENNHESKETLSSSEIPVQESEEIEQDESGIILLESVDSTKTDAEIKKQEPESSEETLSNDQVGGTVIVDELKSITGEGIDVHRYPTRRSCKKKASDDEQETVNSTSVQCKDAESLVDKTSDNPQDTKLLEPIPFKDGIPQKTARNRSEFRLPCHVNLLKRLPRKRKAPVTKRSDSKRPAKEVTVDDLAANNELDVECTKMMMYSPTKPEIMIMKEEDQTGFRRCFDKCSTIKRFSVDYEPVTTLSMDLLGFLPKFSNDDPQKYSYLRRMSTLSLESDLSSPLYTPPSSPFMYHSDSSNQFLPPSNKDGDEIMKKSPKFIHDFDELVKSKIKKIHEEWDLQTDEDQKVARWHQEIKPRLVEAERKPPFSIHEYEHRIRHKLEICDRKLKFEDIVCEEPPCEIARYFSAALQLASTNNLNINASQDLNDGIELILLD